jgi:hypothetical protein
MDLIDIKSKISPYLEMMIKQTKTAEEAESISNQFLLVRSYLADEYQESERLVALLKASEKATYSKAFGEAQGSAAAKEEVAKGDKAYLDNFVKGGLQSSISSWIDLHIRIFSDATTSFRQKADRLGRL